MASFLRSLVRQYGRNPGRVLTHGGRALWLLLTGRGGDITGRLETHATAHRETAEQEARDVLLARFKTAEAAHVDDLTAWICDHTDVAIGTDVAPDAGIDGLHLVLRHAYATLGLFDADHYRDTYMQTLPDMEPADPMDHFLHIGRYAGSVSTPHFDPVLYLTQNPDVLAGGYDPLLHALWLGEAQGRDLGPGFDPRWYLRQNPDVAASGMGSLAHFFSSGRAQGRLPLNPDPTAKPAPALTAPPRDGGTLLLVSHDTGLGGAQTVFRLLAEWLRDHTGYDIRIVALKGGDQLASFQALGPVLVAEDQAPETLIEALQDFAGPDVSAVVLNSVVSGGFLDHWPQDTPVIAYIHELPRMLGTFAHELTLIRDRAARIIAGSDAVNRALSETFFVDPDRLFTEHGFLDATSGLSDITAKAQARARLDLPADGAIIAASGVMHWRKGPAHFIEVAERVLAQNPDAMFLWIGDGPDRAACDEMIHDRGLAGRVGITGFVDDVQPWLDAADVFLLPSQEDPFPLVGLMAARALCPVVCFREAGGMAELADQGAGQAVPLGDIDAMAAATLTYLDDDTQRQGDGRVGQGIVATHHTITTTGPRLLDHIRQGATLPPRLSVIVPNYNYARFLPDRLNSITAQTFQDFEVILLDDASTDDSEPVLAQFAQNHPATRLVVNDTNSGSPFAQWLRGMEMARADLIWVAEADDFCDPSFLEQMLPGFDDPNLFLAHCRPVPVDASGQEAGDYAAYLNRIAPGRWNSAHTVTDHEEANAGLGIANCIPNASGVIFRNFTPEPEFAAQVTRMRMCGDWLFYLRAMRGGQVGYCPAPLNSHRRHGDTVTAATEGSPRYFDELAQIRAYIGQTWHLGEAAQARIAAFTGQDLDRFAINDPDRRATLLAPVETPKSLPSVLFVASDLSPGGGQMFIIRLANAWAALGGRAVLLSADYIAPHPGVVSQIAPRVARFHAPDGDADFLTTLCTRFDIDLIHSSIWWADKYVCHHIDNLPDMPWITTMHGCHETMLAEPGIDPAFAQDFATMKARIDTWVYTAEKNRAVFEGHGPPADLRRIRNGVPIPTPQPLSRARLGLRDDATLFCLASRAIADKGWFAAVEAIQTLNEQGIAADLLLIGEGPARDQIAANAPDHVHLMGHVENLADYIALADVGLLPSTFAGESMPLVLLEMMGQGRPVIASDIGEIADMLGTGRTGRRGDRGAGGLIVPLQNGALDQPALTDAMRDLARSPRRRAALGKAAQKRFAAQYEEGAMLAAYKALYAELVARYAAPQQQAKGPA